MVQRCRRPCLASALLVVLTAGLWWPRALLASVSVAAPLTAGLSDLEEARPQPAGVESSEKARPRRLHRKGRRRPIGFYEFKRAKVQIKHVGQELTGYVKNVGQVASGGALVSVGRGRPCMLLPEDMDGMVEPEQALKVWVKQIVSDGHVLLTMRRPVQSLQVGDRVHGVVTHIDQRFGGIFLDIGAQKDGMLLPGQLTKEYNASLTGPVRPGNEIDAWVKNIRDDGTFSLSMFRPRVRVALEDLEAGQELQGKILKMPRFGGAFLDVGATKDGWLADGQVPDGARVGQEVTVWVKEVNKQSGLQLQSFRPKYMPRDLLTGKKMRGNITGLPKFGGAFVDIGAARDGLLNEADMTVGRNTLELGQDIDVWIKQRRGDSLQLTMLEPRVNWLDLKRRSKVRGRVDALSMGGGVFVDVGFVNHVMLRKEEFDPENLPRVGQEIDVWIKAKYDDGRIDVTMLPPVFRYAKRKKPTSRGIL